MIPVSQEAEIGSLRIKGQFRPLISTNKISYSGGTGKSQAKTQDQKNN
jgi:hypothetical protein